MSKKDNVITALLLTVAFVTSFLLVVRGGDVDPPPGPVQPTMHTLDELFALTSTAAGGGGAAGAAFFGADPRGVISVSFPEFPGSDTVAGLSDLSRVIGMSHDFSRPIGSLEQKPFIIYKNLDRSSPGLSKATARAQTLDATIRCYRNEGRLLVEYYRIVLKNAVVVGNSTRLIHVGGGNYAHVDEVQLLPGTIEWNFLPDNIFEQHTFP